MKSGPFHIFFLIGVLVMCRMKYPIFFWKILRSLKTKNSTSSLIYRITQKTLGR